MKAKPLLGPRKRDNPNLEKNILRSFVVTTKVVSSRVINICVHQSRDRIYEN